MKFGANTFIWASPFATPAHLPLLTKVAAMGFDLIEVAVEDPGLIDVSTLREAARDAGLDVIVCGAFGPDKNLSSGDDAIRQRAGTYLQWCIDAATELGSPLVAGPMYSAVGKPRLETAVARQAEWQCAAEGLHTWGTYARERGVRLAIEPLNRFENDMINVVEQGLDLIEAADCDAVGLHLDTFHMHLEEKDSAAAILRAGKHVFHVHACENDRGVPGTGQVNWTAVTQALKHIDYEGAVVIESFTPDVQSIARAVCIWRDIAPDQDTIAAAGLAFLRPLLSG